MCDLSKSIEKVLKTSAKEGRHYQSTLIPSKDFLSILIDALVKK